MKRHSPATSLLLSMAALSHAGSMEHTLATSASDSVLVDPHLNSNNPTNQNNASASSTCGIWLAPSTIPGAGLGMYAGRDFAKGEYLQEGYGDLVIPIVDIERHMSTAYGKEDDWYFLWDEYTWDADNLQMDHEGHGHINVASPGFGAAANSFLGIFNVEEYTPIPDAAGLNRQTDPGAGAMTLYVDRKSSAKRDISAGQEFFVSYGENWFETRPQLGPIPLFRELKQATSLYHRFLKLPLSEEARKDFWSSMVQQTKFVDSRVLGAFHHADPEELERLKTTSLKKLRIEQSTRTMEWMEEHGTCGDHLVAGPSTLRQAGRGAFAARSLPAGTLVAHLPLIHISDRARMTMYKLGKKRPKKSKGVLGQQLLLNYCYGHGESSLLLCPYGPMVNYINHNASRANVEIRWAAPERGNHMPELLQNPISDLETDATAKLAFELIATRDLEPGEEVFLDYGAEWEQAWQQHVANWQPPEDSESYIPARQFDQDMDTPLWTEFDRMDPAYVDEELYPANVEIRCDQIFLDNDDWIEHFDNGTLKEYLNLHRDNLLPCEIMRSQKVNGHWRYTVVMIEDDPDDRDKLINHLEEDLPREAIRFVDRPYTSDLFIPDAFRHDIRIPDHLFPAAWRDRSENGETDEAGSIQEADACEDM